MVSFWSFLDCDVFICFPKIWLKPNISEDIDSFEGLNYGFLWIASAAFLGGVTQAHPSTPAKSRRGKSTLTSLVTVPKNCLNCWQKLGTFCPLWKGLGCFGCSTSRRTQWLLGKYRSSCNVAWLGPPMHWWTIHPWNLIFCSVSVKLWFAEIDIGLSSFYRVHFGEI